jgi:hypothetical protein
MSRVAIEVDIWQYLQERKLSQKAELEAHAIKHGKET